MASSSHTTNRDPRGIERGKCVQEGCSCDLYSSDGMQASCSYCACPPTKHAAISSEQESSTAWKDKNMIQSSVDGDVVVLQPDPILFRDLLNSSKENVNPELMTSAADMELLPMPVNLPDDITAGLAANNLSANQRGSLCRLVVHGLAFVGRASNSDMALAADKMVRTYPPMRRLSDPTNKYLYKKLLKCRNRFLHGKEQQSSPNREENPTRPLTGDVAQVEMVKKWSEGQKSVTIMGPLLIACRTKRRQEASIKRSLALLVDYPALTIPSLLLSEFEVHPEISMLISVMKERWRLAIPHFLSYYSKHDIYRIDSAWSEDEKTAAILENIHRIPVWANKKANKTLSRANFVLERFPENTPLAEARPHHKDPPRITGLREAGTINYFCFTETEPVFVVDNIIDAIILLLATYWEFNLNFSAAGKPPLLFIAACLFGPRKVNKFMGRNEKFLDLCRVFELEV